MKVCAAGVDRRAVIVGGLLAATGPAAQSNDAHRPIRILLGFAAGGGGDALTRQLAQVMAPDLGRPIIVENRPGAGGQLAAGELKRAAPDGATLMMSPMLTTVLAPLSYEKLPYKLGEFAPVGQIANSELAIAVHAGHPARNLQELVAWMKQAPERQNFGTSGAGSLLHMSGLLLSQAAGLQATHVPFKGVAPTVNAVIGQQISFSVSELSGVINFYRSQKVRLLATLGPKRSPQVPEVPTAKEQGFDNLQAQSWYALYAAPGTPAAVLDRLNQALNSALASETIRSYMVRQGMDPAPGTPAQLAELERRDAERWRPVIRASGFKPE
jgi:tripartite-type tricarboxylate transporter receptor subunit TctC